LIFDFRYLGHKLSIDDPFDVAQDRFRVHAFVISTEGPRSGLKWRNPGYDLKLSFLRKQESRYEYD
jgi:hypothetical protein